MKKVMRLIYVALLLLGVFSPIGAQTKVDTTETNQQTFDKYVAYMKEYKKPRTVGNLMRHTAEFFLGCPYVAHTLERDTEELVVNLQKFDCTTYVETCMALMRMTQSKEMTMERFEDELMRIRYRNGQAGSYVDRLHYITDWLYENAHKGLVKDVNRWLGGLPYSKKIDFMTTHVEAYKPLKDSTAYAALKQIEHRINQRNYYYIPVDSINTCASKIKEGDVIAFMTSVKGLDVGHLVLAYRVGKQLNYINASSSNHKVLVSEKPLYESLENRETIPGIFVIRPLPYF